MKVLGIETSCDETAIGVVEEGEKVLSNVISSQVDLHQAFGGVWPEQAAREHVRAFVPTLHRALEEAEVTPDEIDLIAVAMGPGLIGPLMIGLNGAKALSLAWDVPFIGVNHVEAHLYAAMMSNRSYLFPSLGVVVSGGHTFMAKILGVGKYELIGTTVDDAIGEAFDKVASLLDLPYPGGPQIEMLAKKGDPSRYPYKGGHVKGHPWDFSFSGLKTNVLYTVKGQNGDKKGASVLSEEEKCHVAASFQEVALKNIVDKATLAAATFGCKAIYIGGGVSQNHTLRAMFKTTLPVYWASRDLCLDNGAMIGGLGFHTFKGTSSPFDLEPKTRMPLN